MCGRYTISLESQEISDFFGIDFNQEFSPNYNSAPTQHLPVITNKDQNIIQLFKWGLVPSWAKDQSISSKMINARVETITEKPSFKKPFQTQRCLVIADSYYEWKTDESGKRPFRISLKDSKIFVFAGIWETWHDNINTFSIITTEAEKEISDIHNRMPIILPIENTKAWLDESLNKESALALLNNNIKSGFEFYEVSKKVNSPINNYPELIKAL